MEGECYVLIWGIMHFWQYLHQASFVVKIDHKPLKWLATIFNPFGKRGKWISMPQDFNFKIVHRTGIRHANVDVLNHNLVDSHDEDDDFGMEIQEKGANVVQVQKSFALSAHILTLSQSVHVELTQREEQEEINPSEEFAKENSKILAKVLDPKRKAKRASVLDIDYWGLICKA